MKIDPCKTDVLLPILCILIVLAIPLAPLSAVAQQTQKYEGPRFTAEKPESALRDLQSMEKGLTYVAEKVKPAVVTVFVEKTVQNRGFPFRDLPFDLPSPERQVRGLGSGAIIRSNGYIVTNNHVVADVDDIQVLLPNQEKVQARLVGSDPSTDLAVLKIDRTNLPELDFANSDNLRVGQWAIAVGSPFSLQNSVSYGHISALQRSIQATQYENFIQTDAPINRGNSGGPLVNIHGEIIGINTLIQSTSGGSQGIGFASASNLVKRTVEDLIDHGEVRRAWLGVAIQQLPAKDLREHYGHEHGALIARVKENGPADTAGLESGDLIIEMEGQPIKDPSDLQRRIIAHEPGDRVSVTVIRERDRKPIDVTLGARPTPEERKEAPPEEEGILSDLGLKVDELPVDQARRLGFEVDHPIPIVERIKRGSIAHRAGLRPKDLILSVNREPVTSVSDLRSRLSELRETETGSVLTLVQRDRSRLYISLPLPDEE